MRTEFVYPPIPNRSFDWCAYDENNEDAIVGWGATEQEAIESYLEARE